MTFTDDFSITKMFYKKEVVINIDDKKAFTLIIQPISQFIDDSKWNAAYHLLTMDLIRWRKTLKLDGDKEPYDYICYMLFNLSQFKQYKNIGETIEYGLGKISDNHIFIDWLEKKLVFDGITITSEIWNYINYVLKLSCGEEVSQPQNFESPEAREFFLKQQELDEEIKRIKNQGKKDKETIIKVMLEIVYAFPSFSFDFLFAQTMAQIHWLQKMAAGAVSYSFNEKAYAAGNVKKGKKLDFFIK